MNKFVGDIFNPPPRQVLGFETRNRERKHLAEAS